ncbi:MAG TPA: methyltransferase domain-containing protein [Candidatus Acidoferrales bacterium]|nr:methyltransferase domain-containing protein [Candidatus Acidoferrales bacterium]
MALLADRYQELMALRREGLRRYRANEASTLAGPRATLTFPRFALREREGARLSLGPLAVHDRPPIWAFVERALAGLQRAAHVLEIGPGAGVLAKHLRARLPSNIASYSALERDASFCGPYTRIESVSELSTSVDLVIASEVAEHMTADQWLRDVVLPVAEVMSSDAVLVMSVPNPTSPGGIARDFTHVQNYPWYDLYALMRLEFTAVNIYRAYYAYSAQRVATLLPRILLCPLVELDWCDTLVCTASKRHNAH